MSAIVEHDESDQSVRRVKVNGVRRGVLVYTTAGEALLHTDGVFVACSSATLRAIADLLDSVSGVAR